MRKMKLSFVGAALLISVLRTDAQEYGGSQSYSVSTNYNQQLPDNLLSNFPPPPPPPPRGYADYRVDTYYGNPNQYPPPPPPPPPSPLTSLWSTFSSAVTSFADKTAGLMQAASKMVRNWADAQHESSDRPYPPNSQAYYNGPYPASSSQVVATYQPYNQPSPGRNQFVATYDQNGVSLPVQVAVPSTSYSGPPPPPPVRSQVVVSSDPYNRFPPPPPPPPPVSSQVGASSNNYNVPPPPPPPLANIQVSGSSDSNNGPPPANGQLYNVRMQAPPQNAM